MERRGGGSIGIKALLMITLLSNERRTEAERNLEGNQDCCQGKGHQTLLVPLPFSLPSAGGADVRAGGWWARHKLLGGTALPSADSRDASRCSEKSPEEKGGSLASAFAVR